MGHTKANSEVKREGNVGTNEALKMKSQGDEEQKQ